jgi:hypothetical protein
MGKRLYTTIDTTGPFFTKMPGATFRANARSMLRQMALEGEQDIKANLKAGESNRAVISNKVKPVRVSGHVRAGIPYTPGKSKTGVIKVNVYVPNVGFSPKEGRALMAAYSRVEAQTHAFRRTTARLRKAKAINVRELLKGIAA